MPDDIYNELSKGINWPENSFAPKEARVSAGVWSILKPQIQTEDSKMCGIQGPVVQSIISLTSSLVVKILTVLVSTVSNSQVLLLKNVSSFCKCKSYSHFFSKNISIYAIFNDQNFNNMLINNIISFEQLGPEPPYVKQDVIRLNCWTKWGWILTMRWSGAVPPWLCLAKQTYGWTHVVRIQLELHMTDMHPSLHYLCSPTNAFTEQQSLLYGDFMIKDIKDI